MNRCDFSSISTCLKNHISESNQMSQPDFLYELFEDFIDDPANQDFSMDNGLVCRWMTGQAKISPKISAYYSKPSNQERCINHSGSDKCCDCYNTFCLYINILIIPVLSKQNINIKMCKLWCKFIQCVSSCCLYNFFHFNHLPLF